MEGARVLLGSFTVIKQCIGCRLFLLYNFTFNFFSGTESDFASATDVMSALLPVVMCRKDLPEAAEFLDQFVGKARHSGLVRSHVVTLTNHNYEVSFQ